MTKRDTRIGIRGLDLAADAEREWKQLPYNFQEGQPCPHGCLLEQRQAPPHDYKLIGDCRIPWSDNCCLKTSNKKSTDAAS